jgi:hypothetical protein
VRRAPVTKTLLRTFGSYHRKSLRLRKEKGLPALSDDNDLPPPVTIQDAEGGLAIRTDAKEQVLTLEQEEKFLYHQTKFCHSHTFYRPHETATHFAFPLDLLITIVCLLDLHSMLQCTLFGVTFGIKCVVAPVAHENWTDLGLVATASDRTPPRRPSWLAH